MPKVGNKHFPYTAKGKKAAAAAKKKEIASGGPKKKKGDDYPPEKPKESFTGNPMTKFRGNKTTMKRPSGRKR